MMLRIYVLLYIWKEANWKHKPASIQKLILKRGTIVTLWSCLSNRILYTVWKENQSSKTQKIRTILNTILNILSHRKNNTNFWFICYSNFNAAICPNDGFGEDQFSPIDHIKKMKQLWREKKQILFNFYLCFVGMLHIIKKCIFDSF